MTRPEISSEAQVRELTAKIEQLEMQLQDARQALAVTSRKLDILTAQTEQQRERVLSAVRANEKKYTTIIENMSLGLIEVDNDGFVQKVNSAFCAMTGYSQEELLGARDRILIPESSREVIIRQMALRKEHISSAYEIQVCRKSGEMAWLLISGSPLYNQEGKVVGSIGIHYDLSEQKKWMAELEQAKKTAEEAQEAEKSFLANMSHEIRTPLHALLGMAQLLEDTPLSAEQREYLDLLQVSGRQLQKLVSDILDFSRIESGNLEVQHQVFNVEELVRGLHLTFVPLIDQRKVQFKVRIHRLATPLFSGDESLIRQILVNLLGNAIKFTPEGEVRLDVSPMASNDGRIWLRFSVEDTGIGIAPDQLDLVFQNYKQVKRSAQSELGGSGLGLAIAHRLARLLEGRILVKSEPNKGSVFSLEIPLAQAVLSKCVPRSHKGIDPPVMTASPRILLAEDSPANRKFLEGLMKKWGLAFDSAANGLAALALAAQREYDFILIDLHLPDLEGTDLAANIRAASDYNRDTPILAITASATVQTREKALAAGINDVLFKPFGPHQLCEKIGDLYRQMRETTASSKGLPATGLFRPGEEPCFWAPEGPAAYFSGDRQHALEVFTCFKDKNLPDTGRLIEAYREKNWALARNLAHKLKPGFEMVGLNGMALLLGQIEMLDLEGSSESSLALLFSKVHYLYRRSLPFIQQKIAELSEGIPDWLLIKGSVR
jgi:PAS domain S-box-containing protein